MNFSSDSKCLFVCAFWWFCMIQHSFVDDRAYIYHILKEGRAISLPQILLIGIVRILIGMVGYMSSNSQINNQFW